MPRRFFKKYLPTPEQLAKHQILRRVSGSLHEPAIWHLSRRTVARAFAIGLFVAMLPIPMQMACAAVIALHSRASMPLAISLVWLTNPLTMPPVFYLNYRVGCWLLGQPAISVPEDGFSLAWLERLVSESWFALYFGSVILGALLALIGYFSISALWHWHVRRRFRKRRKR